MVITQYFEFHYFIISSVINKDYYDQEWFNKSHNSLNKYSTLFVNFYSSDKIFIKDNKSLFSIITKKNIRIFKFTSIYFLYVYCIFIKYLMEFSK